MPGKTAGRNDRLRRLATAMHRRLKKKAAKLRAEGGSREAENARRALRAVSAHLKKVIAQSRA